MKSLLDIKNVDTASTSASASSRYNVVLYCFLPCRCTVTPCSAVTSISFGWPSYTIDINVTLLFCLCCNIFSSNAASCLSTTLFNLPATSAPLSSNACCRFSTSNRFSSNLWYSPRLASHLSLVSLSSSIPGIVAGNTNRNEPLLAARPARLPIFDVTLSPSSSRLFPHTRQVWGGVVLLGLDCLLAILVLRLAVGLLGSSYVELLSHSLQGRD